MEYKRLKEVTLSTQYGYTAESTSKTEGTYKYLRITDIVPYFVDFDSVPYCSIDDKDVNKYLVHEDDILVARTGSTTGYNYVVGKNVTNTVYASYLIRFITDKSIIEPKYLKYVLKSEQYYGFVNNYIGGSAQPGMNARVFGRFNIPYWPLPTQRRIASILSTYDSLIENNTRRIRLLEQMAENLYKEWFVRFRFPGHETCKMLDGIPEGWKVERIRDVVKRLPFGKTYKAEDLFNEGRVIVIDQSTSAYLGYHNDEPAHRANIDMPFLLFGDHSCKFQLMIQDFSLGENVIPFIVKKDEEVNRHFLYYAVHKLIVTEEYKRHWGRFSAMKILIPPFIRQKEFADRIKGLLLEIQNLTQQSASLARQRDLLLPRLMSGKIEV